jgi:hypothetical protein
MNSYTMNEAETHMAGATGARVVTITEKEVTDCGNCGEMNITDNDLCPDCRKVFRWQVKEWLAESLYDMTGMVKIGTLTYEPAMVLQMVDPIAYREAFEDFCDMLAKDGYIVENYNDN